MSHSLVYDQTRGVTVFFGGFGADLGRKNDTWEWDGQDWAQRFPSVSPSPRNYHAGAFRNDRVVIYGGVRGRDVATSDELCTWNGTSWIVLPSQAPGGRWHHGLAFDAGRSEVVLFGGNYSLFSMPPSTWTLGSTWRAASPPEKNYYWGAALAYDPRVGGVVRFGGQQFRSFPTPYIPGTWLWDGSNWRVIDNNGPSPRYGAAMAYDSLREVLVLFGGSDADGASGETWQFGYGRGDSDFDGLVSATDFRWFSFCLSVTPGLFEIAGCSDLDFNKNNHIDLSDIAIFQRLFTGE